MNFIVSTLLRNTFIRCFIAAGILAYCLTSCSANSNTQLESPTYNDVPVTNNSGRVLATEHCSGCHQLVPPELLPKSVWRDHVLPSMGFRLGMFDQEYPTDSIYGLPMGDSILIHAGIYDKPAMSSTDWSKLKGYFLENAPDTIILPPKDRQIEMGLKHFRFKRTLHSIQPPHTAMVKILPEKGGIVFSDGKRNINRLIFLSPELQKRYQLTFKNVPVHYYEKSDTLYITTTEMSIFPHDSPDGELQKVFRTTAGGRYNEANLSLHNLQRPVFMAYGDLNNDGWEDIVACEFWELNGETCLV